LADDLQRDGHQIGGAIASLEARDQAMGVIATLFTPPYYRAGSHSDDDAHLRACFAGVKRMGELGMQILDS